MKIPLLLVVIVVTGWTVACGATDESLLLDPGVTGTVVSHPNFESAFVDARNVDIWLPPGYEGDSTRYPVLYMHDGQNLFDPALSYAGVDWGMDEAMTAFADSSGRAAIIVGIWNTPRRFQEYMPEGFAANWTADQKRQFNAEGDELLSDEYLRFLVEELKPWVDERYRTLPDRRNTLVMGSSMGGLISLYAMTEYPHVFGVAAGISTHWPAAGEAALTYLRDRLPSPEDHRIYFDFGTRTLDAQYEPWQIRVDELMSAAGFGAGNWKTVKFVGHEHSEPSWRKRMPGVVEWLMQGTTRPGQSATEINRERLLGDLRYLSSDALAGRAVASAGSDSARARILGAFRQAGLTGIQEIPFEFLQGRRGINVVGMVGGTYPSAGTMVVTAHYDHLGVRDGEIFNGADDNASGTAALLELARHVAASPLRHSVLFAAVDAEEQGLRGAAALVQDPPIPIESVVLNINMDMVSRSEAGELYVSGTYHYPQLREMLASLVPSLPVTLLFGHDEPGTGSDDWTRASDQGPFHDAGIPFLYFGVEDHPGYHRPTDDFEDITPDFYVGAVSSILRVLRVLDTRLDGRVPARRR